MIAFFTVITSRALQLHTVRVDTSEVVSMDTTLVHLVVSEVCVTTPQTRVRWNTPTCHLLARM